MRARSSRPQKEHEGGRKAEDIVRDLGISQGTFYKWKQKYGGMEASDVRRLKDLELENGRLKRLLADTILDKEILKEVIEKKAGERRELITMILMRFRRPTWFYSAWVSTPYPF